MEISSNFRIIDLNLIFRKVRIRMHVLFIILEYFADI